jgi:hypothetical protein
MVTKRLILESAKDGRLYFVFNKTKHYLEDISSDGFDLTCFTNVGYFGGFKVTGFEHDINDYALLEKVGIDGRLTSDKRQTEDNRGE